MSNNRYCQGCHIPEEERDCDKCVCGFQRARLNLSGAEVHNPVPHSLVLESRDLKPSFIEEIRMAVRNEISQRAVDEGQESWEDANDFDIPDDDSEQELSAYQYALMKEEEPISDTVLDNKDDQSGDKTGTEAASVAEAPVASESQVAEGGSQVNPPEAKTDHPEYLGLDPNPPLGMFIP